MPCRLETGQRPARTGGGVGLATRWSVAPSGADQDGASGRASDKAGEGVIAVHYVEKTTTKSIARLAFPYPCMRARQAASHTAETVT